MSQTFDEIPIDPIPSPLLLTEPLLSSSPSHPPQRQTNNTNNQPYHENCYAHALTIGAGTMALLHLGLIIGSYNSTWSDTVLSIHETNGKDFEVPLQTDTTLWSDINIFRQANAQFIVILMIASAVCLPIFQIIIHPLLINWIVFQQSTPTNPTPDDDDMLFLRQQQPEQINRCTAFVCQILSFCIPFLEWISKTALTAIFVQALLLVSMTIHLFGDDGLNVSVETKTRGGLICFLLGGNAGIAVVVFIRAKLNRFVTNEERKIEITMDILPDENEEEEEEDDDNFYSCRNESMSLRGEEDIVSDENSSNRRGQPNNTSLVRLFLKTLLLCESGGIAIVLYPFSFFILPLIRWEYSGYGASFLKDGSSTKEMTLLQIALQLWQCSKGNQYAFLTTSLFWINVILFPTFALVSSLLLHLLPNRCYINHPKKRKRRLLPFLYHFLQYTYPFANLTMFAISAIITAHEMEHVSRYLFDENEICVKYIPTLFQMSCLVVKGVVLDGSWFCLAQALCLDVFVCLTLVKFKGVVSMLK